MTPSNLFSDQVRLLVTLLPHVARQPCFALKGGTALNLFIRDMPRLSVDIDLAYLPVQDRKTSLTSIHHALKAIAGDIMRTVPSVNVNGTVLSGTSTWFKLVVERDEVRVKIEVTPVLRGSVYPPEVRELMPRAQAEFGYVEIQVLSFEDLYAGKLCAALDRQHPRDLFDVRLLLSNEGISGRLKNAFLVYVLSHNRPMAELLAPTRKDIEAIYTREFSGMTLDLVTLESLYATREEMIAAVRDMLTESDRHFLLAVKRGDVDWNTFAIPEAQHLPAVRWKLHNLSMMEKTKRQKALRSLERVLYG